jgi:hypothetical protein
LTELHSYHVYTFCQHKSCTCGATGTTAARAHRRRSIAGHTPIKLAGIPTLCFDLTTLAWARVG